MGPILEEFKNHKQTLLNEVHEILVKALKQKNKSVPQEPMVLLITAQGGIGTNEEHKFLMDYYNLDSVGWATPFLLVPEAANLDQPTLELLRDAEEEDLYLSGISPLGVPFSAVRGSTQEKLKLELAEKGRPGSSCPKKFLLFNTEFTDKKICTASREYQYLKLKELDTKDLSFEKRKKEEEKIIAKECLCIGLANSVKHIHQIENNYRNEGTSVCPGPNLAYFSEIMSLKEIVDHIYGRINVIKNKNRPNVFIKELNLYIDYLRSKVDEMENPLTEKQIAYIKKFQDNLADGIEYYKNLFNEVKNAFVDVRDDAIAELERVENILKSLVPVELAEVK
jgi:hypothetical protein